MKRKSELLNKTSRAQNGKMVVTFLAVGVVLFVIGAISIVYMAQARNEIPPAKAQILAHEQQEIATARAHARPKPPKTSVPSDIPTSPPRPQPQAGILDMHQGPFSPMDFTVRNVWQGPVGSIWKTVYAGGTPKNPESGDSTPGPSALRIYTDSGNDSFHYVGTYPGPNSHGPLTIIAVNGYTMQLRTDRGDRVVFNIQTNQYS